MEQIGNVEAARRAVGDGVEVIVAQGWESGGRNYGGLPTMVLVPQILDVVSPALVLASGGIVDGRSVAGALALGADGVWVGTRLLATLEASVHSEHTRRLLEATGEQTVRSSIFGPEWPHFNPMRVLRNRVVDEWTDRLAEVPTVRDDLPVIGKQYSLGRRRKCASSTYYCRPLIPRATGRRCRGWLGKVSALSMRSGRRRTSSRA